MQPFVFSCLFVFFVAIRSMVSRRDKRYDWESFRSAFPIDSWPRTAVSRRSLALTTC